MNSPWIDKADSYLICQHSTRLNNNRVDRDKVNPCPPFIFPFLSFFFSFFISHFSPKHSCRFSLSPHAACCVSLVYGSNTPHFLLYLSGSRKNLFQQLLSALYTSGMSTVHRFFKRTIVHPRYLFLFYFCLEKSSVVRLLWDRFGQIWTDPNSFKNKKIKKKGFQARAVLFLSSLFHYVSLSPPFFLFLSENISVINW